MDEMHHEPAETTTPTTPDLAAEATGATATPPAPAPAPEALSESPSSGQMALDIPEVAATDDEDGAIDLSRFRLDEHTRELGRRQVALIKAQLAERAAQRAA